MDIREHINQLGAELHGETVAPLVVGEIEERDEIWKELDEADEKHKREEFYVWLATPKFLRHPQSRKVLAKRLGVTRVTLGNWEKELENYDTKSFFLANKVFIDRAIKEKAMKGDYNMSKLAKELSGEYTPKQEVTHKGLTADDIDKAKKQAESELREGRLRDIRIREMPAEPPLFPE